MTSSKSTTTRALFPHVIIPAWLALGSFTALALVLWPGGLFLLPCGVWVFLGVGGALRYAALFPSS